MIIVFSGEGNTLAVSELLSYYLGGEDSMQPPVNYLRDPGMAVVDIGSDRRVIWAFPIYAWGVPPVVAEFMRKCILKGENPSGATHYMVCTCGDDIGKADMQWRRIMDYRGFIHRGAFSVIMPNTYVCLKNYNVDPTDLAWKKQNSAPARVKEIAGEILDAYPYSDVDRGSWPWLKTSIINPYFTRFLMNPSKFTTNSQCTGCGICSMKCPMGNIEMADGKPKWGSNCMFCLRCYHVCPTHGVNWGKNTEGKGTYLLDTAKYVKRIIQIDKNDN